MYKAYLLLRGNHQAGPFSLEELTQQQLQPGDLIWIEGRSTCWLFPHEIQALKPFVASPFGEQEAIQATVVQPAAPVYVQQPTAREPQGFEEPAKVPEAAPRQEVPVAETRLRRTVAEVETDYMNWTATKKNKRKTISPRIVLGTALLAGTAVAAILYLNREGAATLPMPAQVQMAASTPLTEEPGESSELKTSKEKPLTASPQRSSGTPAVRSSKPLKNQTSQPSAPLATPPSSSPSTTSEEVRIPRGETAEIEAPPAAREPEEQKPVKEKKKLRDSLRDLFGKKKADAKTEDETPPANNRQANRRDGEAPSAVVSPDLIDISSNEPDNWMMGIKGLKVTLRNRNPMALRSAEVVVIYYSSQNKVLDRKTVSFQNVGANGRQTVSAPDHKHADRVEFQLGEVVAKEDRFARQ